MNRRVPNIDDARKMIFDNNVIYLCSVPSEGGNQRHGQHFNGQTSGPESVRFERFIFQRNQVNHRHGECLNAGTGKSRKIAASTTKHKRDDTIRTTA